ncbi:unnamed protein product [Pocillopora meandrina]|uniref:Ciliary BBSome complex subunit 2 middle region domain-containing protein n=1 Tax=Pocillopora meandrina TaxID=46732 RepID=A0AAU9XSM7_9CNID|nr:unnamed protein product [Pocillopora meandrina]
MSDLNSRGLAEFLVGSEDFDMRVFKDDEMITEMTGTETADGANAIVTGRLGSLENPLE